MKTAIEALEFEAGVLKKFQSELAVRIADKEQNENLQPAYDKAREYIKQYEKAIRILIYAMED